MPTAAARAAPAAAAAGTAGPAASPADLGRTAGPAVQALGGLAA